MKPQPAGGNQMMMRDDAMSQMNRQRQMGQRMGQNQQMQPFPGIQRGAGPMERGPGNPFLEQLQRSGASPEMVDKFGGFNQGQLPPGKTMPNLQGLGNMNALMRQQNMGNFARGMPENPMSMAEQLGMAGRGPGQMGMMTLPAMNPVQGGMPIPGGMNPYAQQLRQTGFNPAMGNTVTAPVRPTGMEDRTPFAPRLKFNNPMQQGPANPEDAQRSRYQKALGGFRGFNRGQ